MQKNTFERFPLKNTNNIFEKFPLQTKTKIHLKNPQKNTKKIYLKDSHKKIHLKYSHRKIQKNKFERFPPAPIAGLSQALRHNLFAREKIIRELFIFSNQKIYIKNSNYLKI